MTVYPQRSFVNPARLPVSATESIRTSPMDWLRRRRQSSAANRAVHRLTRLGNEWHVVPWPATMIPAEDFPAPDQEPTTEPGFLAVGPGGLFSVLVVDHGRGRVLVAGDVIQIGSRRPPYTTHARKYARRASQVLSAAVGHNLVVSPVIAFVGNASISVFGLPKDCLLTTYRELGRLLTAPGRRITAATAEKLAAVARSPWTWADPPQDPAALPSGGSASDDTYSTYE